GGVHAKPPFAPRRRRLLSGHQALPPPRGQPALQRRGIAGPARHRGEEPRLGRPARVRRGPEAGRLGSEPWADRAHRRGDRPGERRGIHGSGGMTFSRITGTGSYLPAKVLTNKDLESLVDTTDEWIVSRTGIRERHIAADNEFTSDLALAACREALAAAGRSAADVDLIVVATSTPDMVFPSSACLLQAKLGVKQGAAFDVQAVCSGFVYALATADKFIRSGAHRCALVVAPRS